MARLLETAGALFVGLGLTLIWIADAWKESRQLLR